MTDEEKIQYIERHPVTAKMGVTKVIRAEYDKGNRVNALIAADYVAQIASQLGMGPSHELLEMAYEALGF